MSSSQLLSEIDEFQLSAIHSQDGQRKLEKAAISVYVAKHANMTLQLPAIVVHGQQSLCPSTALPRPLQFIVSPTEGFLIDMVASHECSS